MLHTLNDRPALHFAALLRNTTFGLLAVAAQPCLAFGGVGYLGECTSFTTCTAALASAAGYHVNYAVSNAQVGYIVLGELNSGAHDAGFTGTSTATVAATYAAPAFVIDPFASGGKAQSDFGANRAWAYTSRGLGGLHYEQVTNVGLRIAELNIQTSARASSAWRDVWSFSANGHFSARIAIDGQGSLDDIPYLLPEFVLNPLSEYGDWYYDLRVWDVTHLSVSDDFELGGPTQVGRAKVTGYGEQRPVLDTMLALDFDFMSGVSYVVTAELNTQAYNGHNLDLFNTARLDGVQLSNGAQLNALSGHNYLAPVPEPASAALWAAGLCGLGLWARRRMPAPS